VKPIGVAIVGAGRISDPHEMGYRERHDARVVAVCDSRLRRAKSQARAWGVEKVYEDYARVLGDPEIDLVELLVPPTW
jgi:predicted dehydrogenase